MFATRRCPIVSGRRLDDLMRITLDGKEFYVRRQVSLKSIAFQGYSLVPESARNVRRGS